MDRITGEKRLRRIERFVVNEGQGSRKRGGRLLFYAKWRLTKRQRVEALREMVASRIYERTMQFPSSVTYSTEDVSQSCRYSGRVGL